MRLRTAIVLLGFCLLAAPLAAEDGGEDAAASEDAGRADGAIEDVGGGDRGAEDAGGDDATGGCGAISSTGACDGDTLILCQGDQRVEVHCPSNAAMGGPTTTCGLVDCADQPYPSCFGHWCVARPGASCLGFPCDVGQLQGCLGDVCAPSTACDPASYLPTCAGSRATYCAYTISDVDCAAGGQPYTCAPPANDHTAACVGLEGAECGTFGDVDHLCASGLRCDQGTCTARDAGTDAGPGTDAARRDGATAPDAGGDGDAGCSCAGGAARAPSWLAIAALFVGRRRRR